MLLEHREHDARDAKAAGDVEHRQHDGDKAQHAVSGGNRRAGGGQRARIVTPDSAFMPDISGVCKRLGTLEMSLYPTSAETMKMRTNRTGCKG